MPDSNDEKLIVELVACSRCGNPFMVEKGKKTSSDLVCDNCIKLEQRKRQLSLGVIDNVIESQKEIGDSIMEIKNKISQSQSNKQFFLEKIKRKSEVLTKSIELLQKIDETKEEKFIDEYKKLFDKLKEDYS
jgi:late competence protein required for DNA uptake (superfamily II DNA/RNA helicase)